MNLLRRHPWLPLAALFAAFVGLWLWWLTFAARHAPEAVAPEPARHAPAR